jgi:hypothetical protein
MQIMKNRLRPNRRLSAPEIVSTTPLATRYVVSAQVLSSLLTDSEPAICGKATLTMVVSSTSMNAPSVTTMAIAHGL